MKEKSIMVWVEPELKDKLKGYCEKTGAKQSTVGRLAIKKFLADREERKNE